MATASDDSKDDEPDLLTPPPNSDVCDRRLSRAARSILERHALPILNHYMSDKVAASGETKSLAPESLWQALQNTIQNHDTCVLNPTRDVYFLSERNALLQAQVGVPRQQLPYRSVNSLYECGICGKTFLTRYYLDLHMDSKHHDESSNNSICPATSWCQFLGGDASCRVQALEDEPYYGRGSGGHGVDSAKVRREWTKQHQAQQHRCRQEDMILSQQQCRQVMHQCFSHDLATDLVQALCDGLTCQDALHRLMGEAHRHVHSWRHEWNVNHRVNFGWSGTFVIAFLVVYYSFRAFSKLYKSRAQANTAHKSFASGKSTRKKQEQLRLKLKKTRSKSKVQ